MRREGLIEGSSSDWSGVAAKSWLASGRSSSELIGDVAAGEGTFGRRKRRSQGRVEAPFSPTKSREEGEEDLRLV